MYKKNKSSCLHVRVVLYYTYKCPNRTPPPIYEHFSLVKGGKEHEVFEMRIYGRGVLNSYYSKEEKINRVGVNLMCKKEKKATGRFLIVFVMAMFTAAVFVWALGGLINNLNNQQSQLHSEGNNEVISGKNISELEEIDCETLANDILSKVKFETKLKRIDTSVAEGMINTDKDSDLNLYMGNGNFSDELIVVKALDEDKSEADQEIVENYLKDMRKSFEAYIPEQAKKISDAVIVRSGCYVIACVTGDKDNAKDIILSEFK